MTATPLRTFSAVAAFAAVLACANESPTVAPYQELAPEPLFHSFAGSEWAAPENLGAVINSAANDNAAALSKDELSLYFLSDRPGGFGGNDIWVARRACGDCPWQPPVNLGPVINTAANEGGPDLSLDGHLLSS